MCATPLHTRKMLSFKAWFEWAPSASVRQTIWATDDIRDKERHDAIIYNCHADGSLRYSVLHLILSEKKRLRHWEKVTLLLVRKLKQIDPEVGNEKIVSEFGFKILLVNSEVTFVILSSTAYYDGHFRGSFGWC